MFKVLYDSEIDECFKFQYFGVINIFQRFFTFIVTCRHSESYQ